MPIPFWTLSWLKSRVRCPLCKQRAWDVYTNCIDRQKSEYEIACEECGTHLGTRFRQDFNAIGRYQEEPPDPEQWKIIKVVW